MATKNNYNIESVEQLEFNTVKSKWIKDMQFSAYFRLESFDLCPDNHKKDCYNLVEAFREATYELMEIAQKCKNYDELKTVIVETHEEFGRMYVSLSKWVKPEWTGFFAFVQYGDLSNLAKSDEYIEKARAEFKYEFPEPIWNLMPKFLQEKVQKPYLYKNLDINQLKELDKKSMSIIEKFGLKEFSFNTVFWNPDELAQSIDNLDKALTQVCQDINIEPKDLGFNSKLGFEMEPGYKRGGLYTPWRKKITVSGESLNTIVHEMLHAVDNVLAEEMGLGANTYVSEAQSADYAQTLEGGGIQITNKKMQSNPYFSAFAEFKKMANDALSSEKVIHKEAVEALEVEAAEMFMHHVLGLDYYKLSPEQKNNLVNLDFISSIKKLLYLNFEAGVGQGGEMQEVSLKIARHISSSVANFNRDNKGKDKALHIENIPIAHIYGRMADVGAMTQVSQLFNIAKDPKFYKPSNIRAKAIMASTLCSVIYGFERGFIKLQNLIFNDERVIASHRSFGYLQEPKELLARSLETSFYINDMKKEVFEGMGLVYSHTPKEKTIRESFTKIFQQAKLAAFRVSETESKKLDKLNL